MAASVPINKDFSALQALASKHTVLTLKGKGDDQHLEAKTLNFLHRLVRWIFPKRWTNKWFKTDPAKIATYVDTNKASIFQKSNLDAHQNVLNGRLSKYFKKEDYEAFKSSLTENSTSTTSKDPAEQINEGVKDAKAGLSQMAKGVSEIAGGVAGVVSHTASTVRSHLSPPKPSTSVNSSTAAPTSPKPQSPAASTRPTTSTSPTSAAVFPPESPAREQKSPAQKFVEGVKHALHMSPKSSPANSQEKQPVASEKVAAPTVLSSPDKAGSGSDSDNGSGSGSDSTKTKRSVKGRLMGALGISTPDKKTLPDAVQGAAEITATPDAKASSAEKKAADAQAAAVLSKKPKKKSSKPSKKSASAERT